jgi:hypothetical protein
MTTRNSEIAMKFARGALKQTNNHMFIEGDTIYSFSYNHPIAKKWGSVFLLNSVGYSPTTKRHKTLVYHALKGEWKTIIFLPNCDINRVYEQKEMNEKKIVEFKAKLIRARTRQSYYRSGIRHFVEQNILLNERIIPHLIAEKL